MKVKNTLHVAARLILSARGNEKHQHQRNDKHCGSCKSDGTCGL